MKIATQYFFSRQQVGSKRVSLSCPTVFIRKKSVRISSLNYLRTVAQGRHNTFKFQKTHLSLISKRLFSTNTKQELNTGPEENVKKLERSKSSKEPTETVVNWNDSTPTEDFFSKILPSLGFDQEKVQQKISVAKELEAFNVGALRLIENKWEEYFGPVVGSRILQVLKGVSNIPKIKLPNSVDEMIKEVEKMLQVEFNELPALRELKPLSTNKEKLGRFFKTPLPFSDSTIDPRLFDDDVTPAAEEILKGLDKGEFYAILLGKSGDGKTRAIFDVARKYFTIYMETVPPLDERADPTRDKAFRNLYERIVEFKTKKPDRQQIEDYVRHLLLVEIAARVVLFYLLRKKYPQLTQHQFLLAQLNGAQTQLMGIVTHLLGVETQDIRNLLSVLFSRLPRIVFAVDEAGLTHEAFKDEGIWKSPKTNTNRGLLTPLARCLSSLAFSTIFAGTNRSLGFGETLQSDIGKPNCTSVVTKFRSTSEEENENVLQKRLNLDGCNLSKIPDFRNLTGRSRLRDLVLVEICKKEPTATVHSKQRVLEECVKQAVEKAREKLKERFNSALANRTETTLLARLYAATSFFEGTLTEVYPIKPGNVESLSIDLVEIGLASLKYIQLPETQLVVVNEPLSVDVIQEVLRNWSPLHAIRAKLFEAVKIYGAKHEGESLAACVLKSTTNKTFGTVADFAKTYGLEESTLPSWTKEAKLQFPSVAKLHHLGFPNEPTFLDFTLDTITSNPSYCSPLVHDVSHFMRPDVIAVGGINSSRFFSVMISSKLYNEKGFPSDDIEPDFLSTDWNRVYHKKPEQKGITEINDKVKHTRALWDEVLMKHQTLQHVGSLRIHIILPHIQANIASELCKVEGNDVIIYIDKRNAGLLFDTATCEVLAELTGTDVSSWKSGNSSSSSISTTQNNNTKKDLKLPKKPRNSFMIFCQDMRESLDKNLKVTQEELARMWKDASVSDKKKYEEQAKRDKERYNEEMKK